MVLGWSPVFMPLVHLLSCENGSNRDVRGTREFEVENNPCFGLAIEMHIDG